MVELRDANSGLWLQKLQVGAKAFGGWLPAHFARTPQHQSAPSGLRRGSQSPYIPCSFQCLGCPPLQPLPLPSVQPLMLKCETNEDTPKSKSREAHTRVRFSGCEKDLWRHAKSARFVLKLCRESLVPRSWVTALEVKSSRHRDIFSRVSTSGLGCYPRGPESAGQNTTLLFT